ncbi:hypothetical protein PAXRUDRAFT_160221, partial [Paxillus rubicundulus Ve08.2h10]
SFRNETQTNTFAGPPPSLPIILPICAVCLGWHRHSMPVIQCPVKRTWDDKYNTHCERFNKAICTRKGGITLCSLWQHEYGCHKRHDHMHHCSGCGAIMNGASRCPCAQNTTPANTI